MTAIQTSIGLDAHETQGRRQEVLTRVRAGDDAGASALARDLIAADPQPTL